MNPQTKQGEVRLTGAAYAKFKRELIKRDNGRCQNPMCQFPDAQLTIEHIIPRSRIRMDTGWNCAILCAPCNTAIKARYLMIEWSNHFPTATDPPRAESVYERAGVQKPWICVWENI